MDITENTMDVIEIIMDLKKTFIGTSPDLKQPDVNQGLFTSIPTENITLGVFRGIKINRNEEDRGTSSGVIKQY